MRLQNHVCFLLLAVHVSCQPGTSFPTLEQLQKRAAPWKEHLSVEKLSSKPSAFLLRNVFKPDELKEMVELARESLASGKQENVGKFHGITSIDKWPEINASKALKKVNKRLARIAGFPETHVEEGYFSLYTAGHQMESMHLDNHHALFDPRRIVSIVLYVVGTEAGLESGRTVIPLGDRDRMTSVSAIPGMSEEALESWDGHLDTSRFKLGDDPQLGRVCPSPTELPCDTLINHAKRLCDHGTPTAEDVPGVVVEAIAGDALMFFNFEMSDGTAGSEVGTTSARTMHASCGVTAGAKVILSKFIRARPRPFNDEEKFVEARQARADAVAGEGPDAGSAPEDEQWDPDEWSDPMDDSSEDFWSDEEVPWKDEEL